MNRKAAMYDKVRQFDNDLVKYYEIEIADYEPITSKSFKITTESGQDFFFKETNDGVLEKYQYLSNQGINNVLYPLENKEKKLITRTDQLNFYISDYIRQIPVREDVKAVNIFKELNHLHEQTIIKKTLDPSKSRAKFDELSNQLDYKFKVLEQMVRRVESRPLDLFSMPILENYHTILDAKKELVKLQKRIISSVKARESVNYSFLHNNPSVDHLLNIRGVNYLVSLDNGKIGISSLDMAKFYVKNEEYDVDFKSMILNEYFDENHLFYYDYFRYLILVIYIKRMPISTESYINANSFVDTARLIQKYFDNYLNYQEQTGYPNETNN